MMKLLPKKHISLEQSLIGFSCHILTIIGKSKCSLEYIWENCNTNCIAKHTFDDLILTIDYLYAIGVLNMDSEGRVCLN